MTVLLPAEYIPQRSRVRGIIEGVRNASASDQGAAAAYAMLDIELVAGSRFLIIDGDPFLFTSFGKKLLTLNHNDPQWAAHMVMVYGLNTKDREITPKVTNLLASYALWHGSIMQPRRWTAYVDNTLYLSRYDGTVYKLTGAGVTEGPRNFLVDDAWTCRQHIIGQAPLSFAIEDNGRNVLFADDDSGSVPSNPIIGRNGRLFKLLRGINWAPGTTSGMRPKHQVQVLMIWMLALAFSDAFPTKPILICEGPAGSGKCLQRGTKVLMFDGTLRNVEDVRVGDLLMGPDSKPRRVQGTTTGTGPLYQVTPVQGEPWVCNDKHILTLVRTVKGNIIDVPIKEFAAASNTFKKDYKQFMTGVNFPAQRRTLPIDPYFLGVWYGDGNKGLGPRGRISSVQVTKPDPEIEQLMRDTATVWNAQLRRSQNSSGCPTWSISLGLGNSGKPNPLLDAIRGVFGGGEQLPHQYLAASHKDRAAFLAGLLDTDGYLHSGCFEIIQKRRGFADGICFLARSLGLRATMSPKRVPGYDHTYWRVNISGELTILPLRIPRKQPAPRRQIKNVTRTGITVKPIGVGEYAGFQLDGDGRFLLGDFTVTHNSTSLQMIQQALFGAIEPFTVSEDGLRDFWITLLRSPIMILDNTDDMIKWLPDQLAAYTTRGYRSERKLHTNTGNVAIRPKSFIAVASKDPKSFRRDDIADRSIVLRMEWRFATNGPGGDSGTNIAAWIDQERNLLWGEWLYYLNRVVAALRLEPPRRTTSRLGDLELFAYAACRALGWQSEKIVPELMEALSRERRAFAAETDIVLDVLRDWMDIGANEGREITARELFRELAERANTHNKPFVKTPQALAQRLRAPHISATFDVYDTVKGDRKIYQVFKPTTGN